VNFITTKTGVRGKLSIPKSHVVATTSADFDKVALDESKDVLMEFYAPWCGHCKALAPTWEELAKVFQLDEDVVIAKLDSDSYRETAATYEHVFICTELAEQPLDIIALAKLVSATLFSCTEHSFSSQFLCVTLRPIDMISAGTRL